MIYNSIWADTYYTYSGGTELEYRIDLLGFGVSDRTIFSGKAYRRPDESVIKINVARIVENYLFNKDLEGLSSGTTYFLDDKGMRSFKLYNSSGTLLESYVFTNDWSYDPSIQADTQPSGQDISTGEMYGTIQQESGSCRPSGYLYLKTTRYTNYYLRTIVSNAITNSDACGNGCTIIFQNRRGGWNCFYPMGKIEKSENITDFKTELLYNNNTNGRGVKKHVNEITTTWTMHTGWLSDYESENIARNLLLSPNVYLSFDQNIANVIPVVITNSEAPHKTYNNEKGVVDYELTFEASQKKTRR